MQFNPEILIGFCAVGLFAFGGLGLLYAALKEFLVRQKRLGQMEKLEGRIVDLNQETRRSTNTNVSPRNRVTYVNFPVIEFSRANGEKVTFTSETGDTGNVSKYVVGDRIEILYDPSGELKPMLNTSGDIWGPAIAMAAGGIALLVGAGLVLFILWRNNFGA